MGSEHPASVPAGVFQYDLRVADAQFCESSGEDRNQRGGRESCLGKRLVRAVRLQHEVAQGHPAHRLADPVARGAEEPRADPQVQADGDGVQGEVGTAVEAMQDAAGPWEAVLTEEVQDLGDGAHPMEHHGAVPLPGPRELGSECGPLTGAVLHAPGVVVVQADLPDDGRIGTVQALAPRLGGRGIRLAGPPGVPAEREVPAGPRRGLPDGLPARRISGRHEPPRHADRLRADDDLVQAGGEVGRIQVCQRVVAAQVRGSGSVSRGMTVATGFRPRSWEEHVRLAGTLAGAPGRVGVQADPDGWVSAQLQVAGRCPVWASEASSRPAARSLVRLGLGELGQGRVDAWVGEELRLRGRVRRGLHPLPHLVSPSVGTVVVTRGPHAWTRLTLQAVMRRRHSGPVVVVNRSADRAIAELIDRSPGLRALSVPGATADEALLAGVDVLESELVLVVPEDTLPLPGAVHALSHALLRRPDLGVALGDTIEVDGQGSRVLGVRLAPRHDHGAQVLLDLLPVEPVMLMRREVLAGRASVIASVVDGGVRAAVVPLFTATRRQDDGLLADHRRRPEPIRSADARPLESLNPQDRRARLALADAWLRRERADRAREVLRGLSGPPVPREAALRLRLGLLTPVRDQGPVGLIVDDGDMGALERTLFGLPRLDRLHVLRAVPDASPGPLAAWFPGFWGGFGDVAGLPRDRPWQIALTSDPGWRPPLLEDPSLLPELPLDEAILALAAALGWPLPHGRRRVPGRDPDPVVGLLLDVRYALDRGRTTRARALLRAVCALTDGWRPLSVLHELVEGGGPLPSTDMPRPLTARGRG